MSFTLAPFTVAPQEAGFTLAKVLETDVTKTIDAGGCYVVPGFIDPHEHLLGGSGESGFASQTHRET